MANKKLLVPGKAQLQQIQVVIAGGVDSEAGQPRVLQMGTGGGVKVDEKQVREIVRQEIEAACGRLRQLIEAADMMRMWRVPKVWSLAESMQEDKARYENEGGAPGPEAPNPEKEGC